MDLQSKPNLRMFLTLVVLFVGAIIGGAGVQYWWSRTGLVEAQAPKPAGDLASQVARLNSLVPTQSHAMMDVGHQWTGLWFAAKSNNWPLAGFFFNEARQHIAWTVAINPVRKTPDGKDIDIRPIFNAVDASAFVSVQDAIVRKNTGQFETAYKQALESCYYCHKAAGLPYLRPEVPTAPAQTIINNDPSAKWPE